jgi:glycosyltransferase involved in cell wall biosynthesis
LSELEKAGHNFIDARELHDEICQSCMTEQRHAILIPAYNAAATLEETLLSLKQQDPAALRRLAKVVVADDGSKDATMEVARKVWDLPVPPLELWPNEQNMGERATVNRSFARLKEEGIDWCWVIHADDIAKPHWLRTLMDTVQGDHETVSICASWDDILPDGSVLPGEQFPDRPPVVVEGTPKAANDTLQKGCWWHFSGSGVHLERFFAVGGFLEDMPQLGDLEWLVRCFAKGGQITYVPQTLINYRHLAQSVSGVSFRTNRDLQEAVLIIERHRSRTELGQGISLMARNRARQAFRRGAVALLRRQWRHSMACFRFSASFLMTWLGLGSGQSEQC